MAEPHRIPEREAPDSAALDRLLQDSDRPFVVRGLAAHWPLVQVGRHGREAIFAYLNDRARDRDFVWSVGRAPGGSIFYDSEMAVNFRMEKGRFAALLDAIAGSIAADDGPLVYAGSIDIPQHFTTLGDENTIDLGARQPIASIWIGTATTVGAHNDFPDNLAVCAAGRRRFTLFPPDQFANLYLGPLDNTPAGRAVSMVDHDAPDFTLHPGYRDALAHAVIADLEPGDALFVPSGWYHRVEAGEPFNVLVNYWWRESPHWMGEPQEALLHAILSLRDLPQDQRAIWREMFEHYVFSGGEAAARHLPKGTRGVLDPLDAHSAGRLRAFLLRSLSR